MNQLKFRFLDGLRGIAAFVVLLHHYAAAFVPLAVNGVGVGHGMHEFTIYSTPFLTLLVSGNFSVCIFFVLSGIVLSAKFFRTGDRSVPVTSAAKRYFRLAVPALGSVIIAYVLLKLGLFHNSYAAAVSGSGWWGAFWQFPASLKDAVYEGTFGAFIHGITDYNKVLWTMQIEFIGSFIVFGCMLLFGTWRWRWLAYGFLSIALMHTYYWGFILGLVLCDAYFEMQRQGVEQRSKWWIWGPIVLFGLFLGSYPIAVTDHTVFARVHNAGFTPDQLTGFIHSVAAFCLVGGVLMARPLQRLLQIKPILFMGRISFSFYLLHFMVLGSYTSYLVPKLLLHFGYRTSVLLAFVPTAVISIILAYIYTVYVDEPAIRYSAAFGRWLQAGGRLQLRAPQSAGQAATDAGPAGAVSGVKATE